jgi:RecB family endonuclease NucS
MCTDTEVLTSNIHLAQYYLKPIGSSDYANIIDVDILGTDKNIGISDIIQSIGYKENY